MNQTQQHVSSWPKWTVVVLAIPLIYILSSGPVLAICFWLRESTGWDEFYLAMWLYYPILILGHDNPLAYYIEWWVVDVFDTVGPG